MEKENDETKEIQWRERESHRAPLESEFIKLLVDSKIDPNNPDVKKLGGLLEDEKVIEDLYTNIESLSSTSIASIAQIHLFHMDPKKFEDLSSGWQIKIPGGGTFMLEDAAEVKEFNQELQKLGDSWVYLRILQEIEEMDGPTYYDLLQKEFVLSRERRSWAMRAVEANDSTEEFTTANVKATELEDKLYKLDDLVYQLEHSIDHEIIYRAQLLIQIERLISIGWLVLKYCTNPDELMGNGAIRRFLNTRVVFPKVLLQD
ncbi:MAG: hypothetical protein ACXAEF_06080 [Candidatus Thorarchaeota archaeon]|jgi:hypothetical protein